MANFMMFLHRTRNARVETLRSYPDTMTDNMVNCLDCAALLPSFANSLGGSLRCSYLSNPAGGYALNPIRPVGFDEWTSIGFAEAGAFSYHAVSSQGGTLNNDTLVYDSCLRVGTPDPTQFVNGAIVPTGASRFSNGSVFDAPDSLTFVLTAQPGGGKGSLVGRPSDTAGLPDAGAQAETHGIDATYTASLTAPLVYGVTRQWTAPAGSQNESNQATGQDVRVPPALPGAATDCTTADGCAEFEIVDGVNPFVVGDAFASTSHFDYDGEYRGALASPGANGRERCTWRWNPFVPALE